MITAFCSAVCKLRAVNDYVTVSETAEKIVFLCDHITLTDPVVLRRIGSIDRKFLAVLFIYLFCVNSSFHIIKLK